MFINKENIFKFIKSLHLSYICVNKYLMKHKCHIYEVDLTIITNKLPEKSIFL